MTKKIDGKIYLITNKTGGKQYVGATKQKLYVRINAHFNTKRSGTPLIKKAIVKYGKENFNVEVIDRATSIESLNRKEIHWIKKLNTLAPNGYNYLPGGYTNEAAIKALEQPIRCVDTGKVYGSIIEASEMTNIPHYLIGFCCTGRQDTANGYVFEYMNKQKRLASQKKRNKRKKNKKSLNKRVINLDTGQIYDSLYEVSSKTGISRNIIGLLCAGKILNIKGRNFAFLDKKLRKLADLEIKARRSRNFNKYSVFCVTTKERFSSASEAARKFGISTTTVIKKCKNGKIRSNLIFIFSKSEMENTNGRK